MTLSANFSKAFNSKAGIVLLFLFFISETSFSQVIIKKNGLNVNTVTTAVPFLRINGDARSGGMGDCGVATTADANGMWINQSKMSFVDKDYGVSLNFSPWLKALVNDIYLAQLGGFYKIKNQQTITFGLRYFSLGQIDFTDEKGEALGSSKPNEFSLEAGYSRKLSKIFSLGASLRFVYSNLVPGGYAVQGVPSKAAIAGAADISWTINKNFALKQKDKSISLLVGMNISNIGNKVSYTSSTTKDFIPTNLAVGVGTEFNIDKHSSVAIYMDLNKLLVPTPSKADSNHNGVYDFREKSVIQGIVSGFSEPNISAGEKAKEITIGVGAEYMYNKQFGVRFGYFYEDPSKGNRQFLTAGVTVKYSVVGLNFSYLIPTNNQKNPLDNTLRFSLLFEFSKGSFKKKTDSGTNEPTPTTPAEPEQPKRDKKSLKDPK